MATAWSGLGSGTPATATYFGSMLSKSCEISAFALAAEVGTPKIQAILT